MLYTGFKQAELGQGLGIWVQGSWTQADHDPFPVSFRTVSSSPRTLASTSVSQEEGGGQGGALYVGGLSACRWVDCYPLPAQLQGRLGNAAHCALRTRHWFPAATLCFPKPAGRLETLGKCPSHLASASPSVQWAHDHPTLQSHLVPGAEARSAGTVSRALNPRESRPGAVGPVEFWKLLPYSARAELGDHRKVSSGVAREGLWCHCGLQPSPLARALPVPWSPASLPCLTRGT